MESNVAINVGLKKYNVCKYIRGYILMAVNPDPAYLHFIAENRQDGITQLLDLGAPVSNNVLLDTIWDTEMIKSFFSHGVRLSFSDDNDEQVYKIAYSCIDTIGCNNLFTTREDLHKFLEMRSRRVQYNSGANFTSVNDDFLGGRLYNYLRIMDGSAILKFSL